MKWKKTVLAISIVAVAMVVSTGFFFAEEHPEHPEGKTEKGLTKEELAGAITTYVKKEASKSGGKYQIRDPQEGVALSLTLDKVHKERLSQISSDLYFACADFTSPKGVTYDLDFFMKGSDKEHLEFSEVALHKKDGVARYTWYEDGGYWKKKSVKAASSKK